ncbi:hypothetical protein PsYK624_057280 [Phanerochaete sordida]|uniref:F-box domain-containing protein n=1 Tax=Phanerochaete sordida TaxID=48140 RepID=A0A9P3G882_9APHY|nr:hypothetical protein PsYK624_057280 [Phanerochaete sordida]
MNRDDSEVVGKDDKGSLCDQSQPFTEKQECLVNNSKSTGSFICINIHCLPVELIADIFARVGVHRPALRTSLEILTASHVCRRWRDITLQSPQLWTHLDLRPGRKPEYHRMLIERSQNCSLYVSGDARLCDESQIELVVEVMHRVRSFEVFTTPRASAGNRLADLLAGQRLDARRLVFFSESLEAEGVDDGRRWMRDEVEGRSLLPLLNPSHLRRLYLNRLNDSVLDHLLTLQHLDQLMTLSFRAAYTREIADSYDVAKLAQVLQRTAPSLTRLIVGGDFKGIMRTPIDGDIILPKLWKIDLNSAEDGWIPLLPYLAAPDVAYVEMHLHDTAALRYTGLHAAATKAASMISTASRKASPPQLQVLLNFSQPEIVELIVSGGADLLDVAIKDLYIDGVDYYYSFYLQPELVHAFLRTMLAALPSRITSLVISGNYTWYTSPEQASFLANILCLFADVQDVVLETFALSFLARALAHEPLPLPKLRALYFTQCTACHMPEHWDATCVPTQGDACACAHAMDDLHAHLVRRQAHATPVQRVSFLKCTWKRVEEQEAALAAIIPDFSVVPLS